MVQGLTIEDFQTEVTLTLLNSCLVEYNWYIEKDADKMHIKNNAYKRRDKLMCLNR